jgi:putative solute:sodium symporter small subunit
MGTDSEPASSPGSSPSSGGGADARAYWKSNLRLLSSLLVVWFVVSFGFGILLVEPLNAFRIGEAKLGFWFAQQGSIYVFLVLIAVYVVAMNRLDRKHGLRED